MQRRNPEEQFKKDEEEVKAAAEVEISDLLDKMLTMENITNNIQAPRLAFLIQIEPQMLDILRKMLTETFVHGASFGFSWTVKKCLDQAISIIVTQSQGNA